MKLRELSLFHPAGFGLAVFFYSLGMSCAIELVLIPYLVPSGINSGIGLLGPLGDWLGYHAAAASIAAELHQTGLVPWPGLFQRERFLAVNGLIYYFFGATPLALVPFFSALNAVGATAIFTVTRRLVHAPRLAALAMLPYLLFPTSLFLASHPLKDVYLLAGFFLFLKVQFDLAEGYLLLEAEERSAPLVRTVAIQFFAILLLYIARPYILHLVAITMLLPAARLAYQAMGRMLSGESSQALRGALLSALMFGCVFLANALTRDYSEAAIPPPQEIVEKTPPVPTLPETAGIALSPPPILEDSGKDAGWIPSRFLPGALDRRLRALSIIRDGFQATAPWAPTSIDTGVKFHSAQDLIHFLPRAAAVGMLAPFPSDWLGRGSYPLGKWMRHITGLEMLVVYICFLGMPLALFVFPRRFGFWWTAFLCAGFLETYGLVITNVGTLYRLRYGMHLFLATLGLCAIFRFLEIRKLGAQRAEPQSWR